MADSIKFTPVITEDLNNFPKEDGQLVVDVISNKIAVDIASDRILVYNAEALKLKQDKLSAGSNINIDNNVISASIITNYNALLNTPIINQDLSADGFIPGIGLYYNNIVDNTIYKCIANSPVKYEKVLVESDIDTRAGSGLIKQDNIFGIDFNTVAKKSDIPTIPTRISAFTNDKGYITSSYHDDSKQNKFNIGEGMNALSWMLGTAAVDFNVVAKKSESVQSLTAKAIWTGTQAQYDAIGTKDPETLYIITEA